MTGAFSMEVLSMGKVTQSVSENPQAGTSFGRFLADRGVVLVKEFRPIGQFKGKYKDLLLFETVVLTLVKGNRKSTNYGVRVEHQDGEGHSVGSVFLDFDELDELLEAISFIQATAKQLSLQERDHTEVTYSSRDDARVGFYQTAEEQLAFFGLPRARENIFMPVSKLKEVHALVDKSKRHLLTCGAE